MKYFITIICLLFSLTFSGQFKSDTLYWYEDFMLPVYKTFAVNYDIDIEKTDSVTIRITGLSDSLTSYVVRLYYLDNHKRDGGNSLYLYTAREMTDNKNCYINFLYQNGKLIGIGLSDRESLIIWALKPRIKLNSL